MGLLHGVENKEIELQTIVGNIEQELIEGVNAKIPHLVVGMLFNDEKELRDYCTNHVKEEVFG